MGREIKIPTLTELSSRFDEISSRTYYFDESTDQVYVYISQETQLINTIQVKEGESYSVQIGKSIKLFLNLEGELIIEADNAGNYSISDEGELIYTH